MAKVRAALKRTAHERDLAPNANLSASRARAAELTPDDFAVHAEDELRMLAFRLAHEPKKRHKAVLSESPVGAALLERAGAARAVVEPLMAVWGPDVDMDYRAAA